MHGFRTSISWSHFIPPASVDGRRCSLNATAFVFCPYRTIKINEACAPHPAIWEQAQSSELIELLPQEHGWFLKVICGFFIRRDRQKREPIPCGVYIIALMRGFPSQSHCHDALQWRWGEMIHTYDTFVVDTKKLLYQCWNKILYLGGWRIWKSMFRKEYLCEPYAILIENHIAFGKLHGYLSVLRIYHLCILM